MTIIDHVIFATRDLTATGHRFWEEHGLASYDGGTHPEYGTGNRIVPLGGSYIEIMGIADEKAASENPLGQTVLEATVGGDRWLIVCLRPENIERTAERIGSVVVPGFRIRPDGVKVSWRLTGLERALDERLPFFISWDDETTTPGQSMLEHRQPYRGIDSIVLAGNKEAIEAYVEDKNLPITVGIGEPGLQTVILQVDGGAVSIR
ncbi:MAG: VOC family protein [Actinomycetota bacterium]